MDSNKRAEMLERLSEELTTVLRAKLTELGLREGLSAGEAAVVLTMASVEIEGLCAFTDRESFRNQAESLDNIQRIADKVRPMQREMYRDLWDLQPVRPQN